MKNCHSPPQSLESWEEWIDIISKLLAYPFTLPRKRSFCSPSVLPLFLSFSPSLHPSAPLRSFSLSSFLHLFSELPVSVLLYHRSLARPSCCYFLIRSHNIHLFSADSFSIYLNILPLSYPHCCSIFLPLLQHCQRSHVLFIYMPCILQTTLYNCNHSHGSVFPSHYKHLNYCI